MEMLDGFAELVRRPESEVDLAEGALMIASGADPGLDPSAPLASLDEFAEGVHDLVSLCRRLFVELGFRGEPRQYHSPINSLLHRVVEQILPAKLAPKPLRLRQPLPGDRLPPEHGERQRAVDCELVLIKMSLPAREN